MAVITKSTIAKNKLRDVGNEKADRIIKFISNLRHSTGEWAGQPFRLMPWQENEIIRRFYGTLRPDGTRQYRTVWIEVPRKNGKTEIGAGGFALPMLYMDQEYGAQIYSAANDKNQASLVFNAAAPMVTQSPALRAISKIYEPQKRIVYYQPQSGGQPPLPSFYCAISAEAYTKDGLNAHGVIYDELHAAPNRELWDVLKTSQGARRQPAMVVTTTAGYDRESICWELHDYACKVRDGIIQDDTWLVVIYSAPEDADWTDEDVWMSCNPALGVFRNIEEMRAECKRAQETPAYEMTFRRLYLNQWVNSAERWLPMDKWDACNTPVDTEHLSGKTCYAGLDLSSTTDLTALSLVFPDGDGSYDVLMHFWIPGDSAVERERRDRVPYRMWRDEGYITFTPGNVIDYKYILETLKQYRQKYDIKEIAFDRWGATKLAQDLTDNDFLMVPFGQGFASMSAPTKELMNLVLGQKIRHGGNPVLRWNADNLVVQQDPAGNLKPDKARATQKVDGCVALIMALDRASRHSNSGESVYSSRGLISI